MGNSLRDQLLKAGLIDEKRIRQSRQGKRKAQTTPADKAAEPSVKDAQREKQARDLELNRQQQEQARRKALAAEIKQLIAANRLPKRDGEVAYNFVDGAKIKRLYVTEPVHQQLTDGRAVVVKLHGQYDIVPAEVAEKIRARDPACVVAREESGPAPDGEDPYADFQVPDDLMW